VATGEVRPSGAAEEFVPKSVARTVDSPVSPPNTESTRGLRNRPGYVDLDLDARVDEKRLKTATASAFLCVATFAIAFMELSRGLERFGWSLSVSAAWGIAAVMMAESAGKDVPRWQRYLSYALTTTAAGFVIAALVAKYLR
jgi:hypothetical protein